MDPRRSRAWYEEIVHIPLFAHDPRRSRIGRTDQLTQSVDIAPTLLDFFRIEPPPETQGTSLLEPSDRQGMIFGYFGGAVNVTDGRYTYHRFPEEPLNQELYQYTLMPTHLNRRFTPEELSSATLARPFGWTKSVPLLKIPVTERSPMYSNYGPGCLLENDTRLYDLLIDPGQEHPLQDRATEVQMTRLMHGLMRETEAPPEAFTRLALDPG